MVVQELGLHTFTPWELKIPQDVQCSQNNNNKILKIKYEVTEYLLEIFFKKCGKRSLHQMSTFKILIPVF